MHVKCVHGADLQDCSYSNCTLALSILQAAFTASDGSQKNEIQPLYHHHFFEGFEFQNQLGTPTPYIMCINPIMSTIPTTFGRTSGSSRLGEFGGC